MSAEAVILIGAASSSRTVLRAKLEELRDQYERHLKDLQETYGEAMLRSFVPPWSACSRPCAAAPEAAAQPGHRHSESVLHARFSVLEPALNLRRAASRTADSETGMALDDPQHQCRSGMTVAELLAMGKNTVQRSSASIATASTASRCNPNRRRLIQFYNHRRPHQALGMKTPAEAYALEG